MVSSTDGRVLKRANPNTIQDKFLVGYQGWFTCAGDGPPIHNGHHGWLHWFNTPIPDGGRPTLDAWPDVSDYTPSELFPAPGLTLSDGSPAQLFSSRHPQTVQRHFHWMAEHGVDGCFLQRFAGQCEVDGRTEGTNADIMRLRDEVGDRVREAAEQEGRVFAIMYDVSGVPADRIEKVIRVDWAHLMRDKRVLDSPNYLRENGKPVIALWGFGFAGRGHSPDVVRNIVRHIRASTPGGAYVMAGVPTHWQTLKGDADSNPEFLGVWYNEFDAISPWTVGRYHNEETADRFAKEKIAKDIKALKNNTGERKVDYIPVVFPGGSGVNLSQGKWPFNQQPRDGGRFLWRQLYNVRKAGARIIYGAMWDEYDEGTAFLPVVSKKRELPTPGAFLALDADGYDLPPDWYMRIAGFAGEILRGERSVHETFPAKDLQDYWSSRPRYEPAPTRPVAASSSSSTAGPSGSGSADGAQSYEAWCEQEKEGVEGLPLLLYSLEAMSSQVARAEEKLHAQIAKANIFEAYWNTVSRSRAIEKKPGEIEQALHTIYDAVCGFVTSGSSRSSQMLASLQAATTEAKHTYNIKEVMDSHGSISPSELARKLWELLECDEQSKHQMGVPDLRSLSIRFCQQLEKWADDAENIAIGLKMRNLETKGAEDHFTLLERAHRVFPNDNTSYNILSMLIFAPFQPVHQPRDAQWGEYKDDKVMMHINHIITTQDSRYADLSVELMKALNILVGRIQHLKPSYPVHYLDENLEDEDMTDEDAMDEDMTDEDAMDEDTTDEDATDEGMTPDTSLLTHHELIATGTAST